MIEKLKKPESLWLPADLRDIIMEEPKCDVLNEIDRELKKEGMSIDEVLEGYFNVFDAAEVSPTLDALLKKYYLEILIDNIEDDIKHYSVRQIYPSSREILLDYVSRKFHNFADSCRLTKRVRR